MQRDQLVTVPISRRVAALIAEDDELAGNNIAKGIQMIANLRYQGILDSEMNAENEELRLQAHRDHRGSASHS